MVPAKTQDENKSILNEEELQSQLNLYESEAIQLCNRYVKANWNKATDVGNKEKEIEAVS